IRQSQKPSLLPSSTSLSCSSLLRSASSAALRRSSRVILSSAKEILELISCSNATISSSKKPTRSAYTLSTPTIRPSRHRGKDDEDLIPFSRADLRQGVVTGSL